MRLDDLARRVDGRLDGSPDVEVDRVSAPEEAGPGALVVLSDPRLLAAAEARASAVILPASGPSTRLPAIYTANVRLALALALRALHPPAPEISGVHPTCVIGARVSLGTSVYLGPFVVVEDDVAIGDRTRIHAHGVIERGVRIGPDSLLHPRVTVRFGCVLGARVILQTGAVIGSDGFGYAQDAQRRHVLVPQIGTVEISDDVEIGANSAVDRGTLGATRIGRGTKLDNFVHIAHNVEIGEDSALAAACAVAGSVRIGRRVLMGGMSGIADHVTVGDDVIVLGGTGITRDVPPGTVIAGRPALPRMGQRRSEVIFIRLPETVRRLADLRRRVERLEGK